MACGLTPRVRFSGTVAQQRDRPTETDCAPPTSLILFCAPLAPLPPQVDMDAGPRVFPPYGSARLQPAKRLPAVGSRYGTLFFIGVVWGLQLARVHAPPCEQCYFVIPADSWRAVCIPAVAGVALTAGPDLLKRVRSRTVALAVASLLASVAHTAIRFPHNCFLAIAPHAIVPAASGKWRIGAVPAARWACTPALIVRWTRHAACLCSSGAGAGVCPACLLC